MSEYLDCVEIEPQQSARASVIWLHGLGADGHDFEPIVPELALEDLAIRFIFPHAKVMPVSINNNMPMRAWYDIKNIDLKRHVDCAEIERSAALIGKLIHRECERGIALDKILIAGFSQGGAVAYQTALSFADKLAGLVVLSSYLATAQSIHYHHANQDIEILICHGSLDPVVPISLGEAACASLQQAGYQIEFHRFGIQHSVSLEEIKIIAQFIRRRLS